jgi:hypothetical protein
MDTPLGIKDSIPAWIKYSARILHTTCSLLTIVCVAAFHILLQGLEFIRCDNQAIWEAFVRVNGVKFGCKEEHIHVISAVSLVC